MKCKKKMQTLIHKTMKDLSKTTKLDLFKTIQIYKKLTQMIFYVKISQIKWIMKKLKSEYNKMKELFKLET